MDPVTGVGLIAAVIQLVKFGVDTVSAIRRVHQQGSAGRYDDAEYTTNHLADLTRSLQQSLQASNTQSPALSKAERDLIDVGRKCEDCAGKLQHELGKLHLQPRSSVLAATRKVFRSIWKQPKIDEISKDLASYQAVLETSLLSRLRYVQYSVTCYPMHWQGVNPGATPEFSNLHLTVCRLHELIRERVWKTTFFPHSCIRFRNRHFV